MYKLACKDLSPQTSCTFESVGATAEEAARAMLIHARVEHADDIKGIPDEQVVVDFAAKAHV